MSEMVRSFSELTAEQRSLAGGKGGALAQLHCAGYPVPDGFVILPEAFADDELKPEAWGQAQVHLARLRRADGEGAFAVRSSALSEDSAQASFAGEFETVLDVHSDEAIRAAISTVRHSRHSERVKAYSKAQRMDAVHDMAVVVQRLIRADISGVLFTADPVSGDRATMTGNYIFGLGDELVSGEVEPYAFTLGRPQGRYMGPPDLARFARRLYRLGKRLEDDLDCPQDIEWAIAGGVLYLLQSRPITTLTGHDPAKGEWNATLTGDYLWSNVLNVEVFPQVTTPSTWSVWQVIFDRLALTSEHPSFGNIAGRVYFNYSIMYSFLLKLVRSRERVIKMLGSMIALPPEGIEIPPYPVSLKTVLLDVIPREIKNSLTKRKLERDMPEILAAMPERCRGLRRRIAGIKDGLALISLWEQEVKPLFIDLFTFQDAMNERFSLQNRTFRQTAIKLLGEDEANALVSIVSSGSQQLASMGPLLGLASLGSGELSRDAYLEQYGHRGTDENYLLMPRPYEDPGWLDRQLEEFNRSSNDVALLIEKREGEFETVWKRLEHKIKHNKGSRKAQAIRGRIGQMAGTCITREATRSELTRVVGVIRAIFVRVGELTGLGDDVFFLTIGELTDLVSGNSSCVAYTPARRKTYERYKALPPLPTWISGRIDPFQWAADPHHRADAFDSHAPLPPLDSGIVLKGNAGSAGRVSGSVRRIDHPNEGGQLQPGEILVTATTNIGWTPLFPRAAAIVTDIGGALSHAAIVAREIGIPAVVGCGNATMRLRTGDRVLVDGGRGVVEILKAE